MGGLARATAILVSVALLAGCGLGQRIGWFGASRVTPAEAAAVLATDPLVDQVVSLSVDPTPTGAIVSAVGLPPTQGYWGAELAPVASPDPSALVLEFRLLPPPEPRPVGTQPSREVLAGTELSNQDLAGVRTITVRAARNVAASRR
jgi:hypothetical protein